MGYLRKTDDEAVAPEQPSRAPLLPAPAHAPPDDSRISLEDSEAAGNGDEDLRSRGLLASVSPDDTQEILRLRGLVDTRLHSAARAQDLAALRALLGAGAAPDALDREGRTPLHLCVVLRLIEPFKVLLSVPGSAEARDASGWPLLHAALLHGWRDGVRAALDAGARVDVTFVPNLTAYKHFKILPYPENRYPNIEKDWYLSSLHRLTIVIAMSIDDMDMFEMVLTAASIEGVVDRQNHNGWTALYNAIVWNDLPAIQALLKKGASPHKISDKDESALHAAVRYPNILKYFLDNTDVMCSNNKDEYTPIQSAALFDQLESFKLLLGKFKDTESLVHGALYYAAIGDSYNVAKFILENGTKAMTCITEKYECPLRLAARCNSRKVTALLLQQGRWLSDTGPDNKLTVLDIISRCFCDPSKFFKVVFDSFVNVDDLNTVFVDYKVLTHSDGMSQINVLEELTRCGQSKVLIHPLIESLVYLKWTQFVPLFYALISVYTIFLVSVNVFVVGVFYYEDTNNSTANSTAESPGAAGGLHAGLYWLLIVLIYGSTFILLLQEFLFICVKKVRYFLSMESWVKLLGLVLCAGAPLAALAPGAWPRHAACAALLLAWLQAMFLVSRVSRWGYYVLMFGKVAVNILKILVTAIFLVIAFAFCFMIQYQSTPPFDGPFSAFVKTLVMMSSEFDYEDLFGDDHKEQLQDTQTVVRILFVIFVVFVAIVLMNFMIGVAVSDISDLNETGNIRRLEKQVELLSTFEPLAYDGILAKWFIKLFGDKKYHNSMYTSRGNQSTWHVDVRKPPYTKYFTDNVRYDFQIRSSKLYNAIAETPSKQDQADQEARRHNTERPYRSQMNALNALADKPAGSGPRGESIDLIDRKMNNFNSRVFKQHLGSLANNSSKHSRDIEVLKQGNALLNLQINRLTAISSDVLRSVKAGPNWTSLARRSRRPRRRVTRRTRGAEDELFPSFMSQDDPFLAPSTNRGPFDFLSSKW